MSNTNNKNESGLNVLDLFFYLLSKWPWFLLSILVCGGFAWYQYAKAPFVYFGQATVIIKDPSNKTSSAGLDRYDNLINKVNVANEILQFRSKKLMSEVVSRLDANVTYTHTDGLRDIELYTQSPVKVSFFDFIPSAYTSFTVTPMPDGGVQLSNVPGTADGYTQSVAFGDTVLLSAGRMVVNPTNFYSAQWSGVPITVARKPVAATAAGILGRMSVRQQDEESSILLFSMQDSSPVRIEDILNTLIDVYNEEAINDKNRVAVNTADFINERLIIIENELGGVESQIEKFKQDNKMYDVGSAAGQYMGESQRFTGEEIELETQLRIINYVKEYLVDPSKETELIPTNTGVGDSKVEGLIAQYNSMKVRRDNYIEASSERNPVVQELNNNLRATKQTIIRTIDNLIVSIEVRLKDARSQLQRADARLATIPTKEREILSIERQQKIKESLYLFLLNRREENALTQAMADNNARVIDSAEAGYAPISPIRNRILLMGLLLGFAVPAVIFLLIMFLDTRVQTRKDLEAAVTLPYLGEIPIDKRRKRRKNPQEAAVKSDGDDLTSEAFRIVRTNLSFMMKKDEGNKVITFTSFNPGAGKTYIARNLAVSLAHAGKRVIIVDLDIRRRTISRLTRAAKIGLTDFIVDKALTVNDIIQSCKDAQDVDIISAGSTAPNPAELLMDGRLDELFAQLRQQYDFILADNVPAGIVADGDISNRVTDLTLFVVRAGLIDKRQLPDLEQLYRQSKYKNMALVLNGADPERRGYGYSYGYGYGYGYGYSYGYGKK